MPCFNPDADAGPALCRGPGRRSFASFVSGFSTIGILLGVAALMLVSSVMNGFEQQLKSNLLGVIPTPWSPMTPAA
ncbi:hypothetical protein MBH78_23480 [Oceanimonas sp. NS1]|nr:hypothetical protein [Oceanimonas sp. NS1]